MYLMIQIFLVTTSLEFLLYRLISLNRISWLAYVKLVNHMTLSLFVMGREEIYIKNWDCICPTSHLFGFLEGRMLFQELEFTLHGSQNEREKNLLSFIIMQSLLFSLWFFFLASLLLLLLVLVCSSTLNRQACLSLKSCLHVTGFSLSNINFGLCIIESHNKVCFYADEALDPH